MQEKQYLDTFHGCKERALDCLSYFHHISGEILKGCIEEAFVIVESASENFSWVRWSKDRHGSYFCETLSEMFDFDVTPKISSCSWLVLDRHLKVIALHATGTEFYFSPAACSKYAQTADFKSAVYLGQIIGSKPSAKEQDQEEYCPICDGVGSHSATCFRRKS